MIATLRGTLNQSGVDHLVLEVGGVGLLVYVPRPLLAGLGPPGSELFLHTLLIVREDALSLYGFANLDQRQLFERLLSVAGIGPRVALSLLSSGPPDELRLAIAQGDTARLARVPGIGKKTAERLVLELKGKLVTGSLPPVASGATPATVTLNNELAELLASLGYSSAEASAAIAALPAEAPEELETRLRLALRFFGSA